jgi:hypothetical protein
MTIQEFPLAWRWTQSSHAILPADVLARIRPLSQPDAALIYGRSSHQRAEDAVSYPASDSTRSWLRNVQPDLATSVFVSWSEDLAVETTWEIFTEFWDDFCYPSSDDVSVIPVGGSWHLTYHHYEQFNFVGRPST